MLQFKAVGSRSSFFQSRRLIAPRPHASRPRTLLCRAEKEGKPTKEEEYVEALKKGGINDKVAKQVFDKWKELGVGADPNTLRKLFLKQSFAPIAATALQTLLDGLAAYSIFLSATFIALGPEFTGRNFIVFGLNFLSIYFAVCVVFDVATAVAVLVTAAKLQASPEAYYEALKTIAAGDRKTSGLAIVDKAQAAVNAVKVSQALDAISKMLDEAGAPKATSSVDTLANLSAFVTLYRSETRDSFDPSAVGMTEVEAGNIARVFGQYDLDDNGRLDSSEFRKMVSSLGTELSDSEVKAAMEVMDENKDTYIQFDEFAKWWALRKGLIKA